MLNLVKKMINSYIHIYTLYLIQIKQRKEKTVEKIRDFYITLKIPRLEIAFDLCLPLPKRRVASCLGAAFFGSFEVGNQLNCLSTPEKPAHALPFPALSSLFYYTHVPSSSFLTR